MIFKPFHAALPVVFVTALAASPALAVTPLAPATYDYFAQANDPTLATPDQHVLNSVTFPAGPQNVSATAPTGSWATSSSIDAPFSISATATAVPTGVTGERSSAQAETNIQFELSVSGPTTTVPVHMTALFQSLGQSDPLNQFGVFGNATGYTELVLDDNGSEFAPDYYRFEGCAFQGCTTSVNASLDAMLNLKTGVTYTVRETVLVIAAVLGEGVSLTSSASADPHFNISAAYLANHPGVGLTISPGLQSWISSVPEPGTWTLMAAGAGLIGAMIRRRRGIALRAA